LRITGWIGLSVLIIAEVLLFIHVDFVGRYFTPIQWWAYILFLDALIEAKWKKSYIFNNSSEFFFMALLSFVCWLTFEFYNIFFINNWYYIELPNNIIERWFGYFISFSTIFPGIFLTARLLNSLGLFKNLKIKNWTITKPKLYFWITLAALFLIFPFFYASPYIFALVWMGFSLLFDPINYLLKNKSFLADFENGKISSFLNIFIAGYICGFLWEFWNYWATTKWIYSVPFTPNIKIFEMPIAGFTGFGPFAIECYCMYEFLRKTIIKKYFKIAISEEII